MSHLLKDQKMTAVVFFLDETFDELMYDLTTTVAEAVEQGCHRLHQSEVDQPFGVVMPGQYGEELLDRAGSLRTP